MLDIKDMEFDDIDSLSDSEMEELFEYVDKFDCTVLDFAAAIDVYVYKDNNYGTDYSLNYYKSQILRCISMNPDISATEIAKKLQRTPAYMSKMITELENMGLLKREINPENRRFFILKLTDKGRAYDKAHLHSNLERMFETLGILKEEGFDMEDISKSRRFLEIMADRLKTVE